VRGSIAKNVQTWGTGALNIDATRIPTDETLQGARASIQTGNPKFQDDGQILDGTNPEVSWTQNDQGRFPSNVIGSIPDYQKYFYCPKVSRKERHVGFDFDTMPTIGNNNGNPMGQLAGDKNSALKDVEKSTSDKGNNHPTVKPIELMKYLIRLITPPGGVVLDPFTGSGSTGCAAVELGMEYIGCELDPAYVEIARTRIEAWYAHTHPLQATGLFE
jgi:site-specific DNA-methyltransferase (adenine-specific)